MFGAPRPDLELLANTLVEHGVIGKVKLVEGLVCFLTKPSPGVRRLRGDFFRFANHGRVAFFRSERILSSGFMV